MADGIVFAGGEPDSFTVDSGGFTINTFGYDPAFSDCAIWLRFDTLRASFLREASGRFWFGAYISDGGNGPVATFFDSSGRAAIKYARETGLDTLSVNTSSTATVVWTLVTSSTTGDGYKVFSVDPATGVVKFFNNGDDRATGTFPLPALHGPLSYAVLGPSSVNFSQFVVSENVNLVSSRLMTRKANAAGTYSGMTGPYTNLVKTSLNDTTAVVASAAGQMSTFGYQDVTVPTGLEMHPTVFVWNRVKNDGSSPTSMKPVIVKSSVVEKGSDLPVTEGFKPIPAVWDGMTPAIFNGAEIGMESSL